LCDCVSFVHFKAVSVRVSISEARARARAPEWSTGSERQGGARR